MNSFELLAVLTVFVHLIFVVFACLGGLLAVRWPRIAWLHLPAAAWAVFIEVSGGICPLTPLELALRRRAGLPDYSGDFVANCIFPVLYPEGLTRDAQIVVAVFVSALNVIAYGWAIRRRRATKTTH
ncbi:MAG TPA: DUF2784 domain-containing protein [Dehalococcoidia bacterium]|nr:DUF2784 domain-containing protein [Dehalococcoidia bacterium]